MQKKTLILGASTNPERYAYKAAKMLLREKHPIILVGNKKGEIDGNPILLKFPKVKDIHTITLYIGPTRQQGYYHDILSSGAKRIIFNPGTHNEELIKIASDQGIECESACTLVMLSTEQY
jgi:uncharacterized protein